MRPTQASRGLCSSASATRFATGWGMLGGRPPAAVAVAGDVLSGRSLSCAAGDGGIGVTSGSYRSGGRLHGAAGGAVPPGGNLFSVAFTGTGGSVAVMGSSVCVYIFFASLRAAAAVAASASILVPERHERKSVRVDGADRARERFARHNLAPYIPHCLHVGEALGSVCSKPTPALPAAADGSGVAGETPRCATASGITGGIGGGDAAGAGGAAVWAASVGARAHPRRLGRLYRGCVNKHRTALKF